MIARWQHRGLALGAVLLGACAAPAGTAPAATAGALAAVMAREPVVLLGEVHDNAVQHTLRLEALRRRIEAGARPAFAFEQFDEERQAELDRVRSQAEGDPDTRAARIVEAVGGRGWDWKLYRPYVALALQYDLPIVAANLSRARAIRIAQEGVDAVFDEAQRNSLALSAIAPALLQAQEREIARGHCGQAPADALAAMATAQVARDAVLARAIEPYAARGVVLLTGNGHARRDIGVPAHLAAALAAHTVSIGLLESGDGMQEIPRAAFDATFVTAAQARPDPCAGMHLPPMAPEAGPPRSP